MALITYPLDSIDYSADDAALFHATRTSGIYAGEDFSFSLSGADNTITLGVGIAWMRLARFKGVVTALKTETNVDMGIADSTYPRIDHLVLQYDANQNAVDVVVKKGTPASSPQPPERATSEALYELHLLQVYRKAGATSITAADVTDLRLAANYCGLMADSVTAVDTSAINAQISGLIQRLREEITAVEESTAFALKPVLATATLLASGWSATAPYRQTVAVDRAEAGKAAHITPVYSGNTDADILLREACAAVSYAVPGSASVTFTCLEDKPAVDIPIQVEVIL